MKSFLLALAFASIAYSQVNYIVETDGVLTFPADSNGYKIPDFSYAGYLNRGSDLLPTYGVEYIVQDDLNGGADLVLNDRRAEASERNWRAIQNAVDTVAALQANDFGYKGAVLLPVGNIYIKNDTAGIEIPSGVILRGSGKTSTVIINNSNSNSPSFEIRCGGAGNGESNDKWNYFNAGESDTKWNVTDAVVNVGDMSFNIDQGHSLKIGDRIIVRHPGSDTWMDHINDGGFIVNEGTGDIWPTTERDLDIRPVGPKNNVPTGPVDLPYWREVTAVDGTLITVDAPIPYSLVRATSQSFVYKYTEIEYEYIGIEDLTVDLSEYWSDGQEANNPANNSPRNASKYTGIQFENVQNGWCRNVLVRNFRRYGISLKLSRMITVSQCDSVDPHSEIKVSFMYNFNVGGAQLNFFEDCYARGARHSYIAGAWGNDSLNVLKDCKSENAFGTIEFGHLKFCQATLIENMAMYTNGSPVYNAENKPFANQMLWFGNHEDNSYGQGWSAVNSIAWRCTVEDDGGQYGLIQVCPTGVNWEFECLPKTGQNAVSGWISDHPLQNRGDYPGIPGQGVDSGYTGTLPTSLYETQLAQRLNQPILRSPTDLKLIFTEFTLGE